LRLGFTVVHDPLPDDTAHALVIGENTKQAARALATITTIVIPPTTTGSLMIGHSAGQGRATPRPRNVNDYLLTFPPPLMLRGRPAYPEPIAGDRPVDDVRFDALTRILGSLVDRRATTRTLAARSIGWSQADGWLRRRSQEEKVEEKEVVQGPEHQVRLQRLLHHESVLCCCFWPMLSAPD
jgi:hypothetical protein